MNITLLLAMTMATGSGLGTVASAEVAQAQITRTTPAAPAAATQTDARFAHWLGCWRLEDDLVGTGARICITPEQQTGVKLQMLVGAQRGTDELIVPDGVSRPIADPECRGTERSEWSRDGLRVFRYTDVTCGKEPARKVSSVAFLAGGPAWVNVQVVEGGPATSIRVQRYRRAFDQNLANGSKAPLPTARMLAEAPATDGTALNVDDVIEASANLPAEAVQAAISEDRGPYQLNRKNLVAMDEADVPESVIDLMIALTYPQRFVVQRAGGGSSAPPAGLSMGGGWFDPFMSPIAFSSMYDCYSPYGMGYRSYYSPCGSLYSPYGYYGYNYGNSYGYNNYYPNNYGGWVVVDPNATTTATPQAEGRVVNGRGYTQVRPRDAEPSRGRSGNIGNGESYTGGSSSGGSSGVSSQGYSGGSSSGSSGSSSGGDSGVRTAVPRPPGL